MAEEALDNFELELELSKAPLAQKDADETDEDWDEFASATSNTEFDPLSQQSTFGGSSGYASLAGTQENLKSKSASSKMSSSNYGGSLEDLVESFDQKVRECFRDMTADVSELAPAPIRSHDEELARSKLWKDLTDSFGTVLPVDWSKTVIRNQLYLPVLELKNNQRDAQMEERNSFEEEDDEELGAQLDMHAMIASHHQIGNQQGEVSTADEVIKEINAMMQEDEGEESGVCGAPDANEASGQEAGEESSTLLLPSLPLPLYEDKLQEMSTVDQLELQAELERLTQRYSEILVQQLALRDELQFEKEVKNSFISELIKVQNKRRQFAVDRKKSGSKARTPTEGHGAKYLTTIIPYEPGQITTRHMQFMIKILAAINDDSPTTPTLLTDYILKVLCPKENA